MARKMMAAQGYPEDNDLFGKIVVTARTGLTLSGGSHLPEE